MKDTYWVVKIIKTNEYFVKNKENVYYWDNDINEAKLFRSKRDTNIWIKSHEPLLGSKPVKVSRTTTEIK